MEREIGLAWPADGALGPLPGQFERLVVAERPAHGAFDLLGIAGFEHVSHTGSLLLRLSLRERSDREAIRVRGYSLSRVLDPLTPALSPTGRGSPAALVARVQELAHHSAARAVGSCAKAGMISRAKRRSWSAPPAIVRST